MQKYNKHTLRKNIFNNLHSPMVYREKNPLTDKLFTDIDLKLINIVPNYMKQFPDFMQQNKFPFHNISQELRASAKNMITKRTYHGKIEIYFVEPKYYIQEIPKNQQLIKYIVEYYNQDYINDGEYSKPLHSNTYAKQFIRHRTPLGKYIEDNY